MLTAQIHLEEKTHTANKMSLPNKRRRAEDEIVQQMKTLRLGEKGEEERSKQVEDLREVESMAVDEGEMATLLHLVEAAALKYSLSKSDATKVKLISEGRILSLYHWSADMDVREGELELAIALRSLMRLDTQEDCISSYGLT